MIDEIGGHGSTDPTVAAVRTADWIQVVPTPVVPQSVAACRLDAGETAVLSLALGESGAQVVIDDLAARRCAQGLGLQVQGTLGLILVAKSIGMIEKVGPVLESVRRAGLYVSERLVRTVLELAGE
jgi:predicted nucleic acid-binding protein